MNRFHRKLRKNNSRPLTLACLLARLTGQQSLNQSRANVDAFQEVKKDRYESFVASGGIGGRVLSHGDNKYYEKDY